MGSKSNVRNIIKGMTYFGVGYLKSVKKKPLLFQEVSFSLLELVHWEK